MNLGKESEVVEFKRSTGELNEGIISLSAMLNKHAEATVYFGVRDDGEVIGQSDVNSNTLRNVSRKIADAIKPQIIPNISLELIEDKSVIKVSVKGSDIPYSAFGKYYSRSYDEDRQLTPESLKALINREGEPDYIVNKVASRQDLSFKTLKSLYLMNDININDDKFIENLNLLTFDGKYNYMAELLADSNDISLKVVTFDGIDKTTMIKRTEYGHKCLIVAMSNVLNYIESLNETKVKVGGLKREEEDYFDFNSFKEAWLNAIVHTKWSEEIAPVINIYDDRIEIVSNGGLASALSKEDFYLGVSKPVNKKLLKIFTDLDYIEQTGHGVPVIIKNYGREAFYISAHTVIVTIPLNKRPLDGKDSYKELNDAEYKVIKTIKNNPHVTMKEIAKMTAFSISYIAKVLGSLKFKGYIGREGARKNGSYQVLK